MLTFGQIFTQQKKEAGVLDEQDRHAGGRYTSVVGLAIQIYVTGLRGP